MLAPIGALFVFLRRYERERFWRWFVLYGVCGIVGGFLAILLADLASPLMQSTLEAYLSSAIKLLNRAGLHGFVPIFLRMQPILLGLMLWYLGIGFATWVVSRQHVSRRRIHAEKSGEQSKPAESK